MMMILIAPALAAIAFMLVDEIWGKPVVIERVRLDRYDLEDEEDAGSATKPAAR